jgi:pimeloyl-ACP methyl ester carboxylesterase
MRSTTALIVMTLATWATSAAQQAPAAGYPPPGQLINIGDRRLHVHCSGHGTPTVILVAGGGAFSIDWTLVQPRIARITRVCSYDRAGLGWSDSGPAEETVEETTEDLHLLLHAAREAGPYILVGASIGGIYIRAYQHAFPNEVAGLIFANSSHHVGLYVKGKTDLIWKLSDDELRSAYPLPPDAKGEAPTREGEPFDRLPPDVQAIRLWLDHRLWEKFEPTKAGPESMLSWRKEFLRELQESCSGPAQPLGNLPVLVLSSDSSASELARQHRLDHPFCDQSDAGDGLELLSSNSMYMIANGSGHEIHLYKPDFVVQAVERAVAAIRDRVPLSRTHSGQ